MSALRVSAFGFVAPIWFVMEAYRCPTYFFVERPGSSSQKTALKLLV